MISTLRIVACSIMMECVWTVALVLLFLIATSIVFALGSLFIQPAQSVGWNVKTEVLLWKQAALNAIVLQATLVTTVVKILMSVVLDHHVRMVVPAQIRLVVSHAAVQKDSLDLCVVWILMSVYVQLELLEKTV
jgi:hypothetical protein